VQVGLSWHTLDTQTSLALQQVALQRISVLRSQALEPHIVLHTPLTQVSPEGQHSVVHGVAPLGQLFKTHPPLMHDWVAESQQIELLQQNSPIWQAPAPHGVRHTPLKTCSPVGQAS
jgi:hypothetical protein